MSDTKLYLGDCLDILPSIESESIDFIFCDLPYAETGNNWDKCLDLYKLFEQYRRIIKESGCIALTGTMKFGYKLYSIAEDLYKYDWVWEKDNGTNAPNVNLQPFRTHEFIFIFGKGRVTNGTRTPMVYNPQFTYGNAYTQVSGNISDNWKGGLPKVITHNPSGRRHPTTVQRFIRDAEKFHPTQKPVSLCEFMIKTYTNTGGVVLDNCMGSGSTGVAAVCTDRQFIGIELNPKYYDIAVQRIEAAKRGYSLSKPKDISEVKRLF